jgi:hypothetical protein
MAAALVLLAGLSGAQGVHAAGPTGGIVLQPADAHGNRVAGPGYFQLTATPGSTQQLYVVVGNVGQRTSTITLAPVDATSGLYGGVSYNLPQQARRQVGSWVGLSRTRVAARPGKGALVSFSLHVPAHTAPGQYVGALTAFSATSSQAKKRSGRGRSASFQVQLRRVVAIVVTVPGPLSHRFAVTQVTAEQHPTGVYAIVQIQNSGNALLAGQGNLWVWAQGQKKPVIFTHLQLGTTVPHTTVRYPIRWAIRPAPGRYTFRVVVWWQGGSTSRDGTLWVK